MSQADYDTKLRNVHRFIPFLENMIIQLKDPKMKNREQQLSKMESLHQMITDKKKKLKIDTLHKCEEVIIKLFYKVKGDNATLPPLYLEETMVKADEKRKPINVYNLAGDSLHKPNSQNEFYDSPAGCSSNDSKSPNSKNIALRKPPISFSDLECLKKDVAHELEKKMSLHELNTLRSRLCKELEDADEINTTVRNKPVLTKLNAASPDKNKKKIESTTPQPKNDAKKEQATPKKTDAPKISVPKVLKEGDLFCNAFSEIDKSYEMGLRKKDERKLSTHKEKKETQIEDAEQTSLKQLSEKAAQLRKNMRSMEVLPTNTTNCPNPEQYQGTLQNSEDILAIPLTTSKSKTDDCNDKDSKEKCESGKESSNSDKESKHSEIKKDKNEKVHKSDYKKDKDDKCKEKNRDKGKKEHGKDKDRKDRPKEKNNREKNSKPIEKKDVKERKSSDKAYGSKKDKTEMSIDLEKDNKNITAPVVEDERSTKSGEIVTKQDITGNIYSEIDEVNEEKSPNDDLIELTRKIEEIMNAKSKTQSEIQEVSKVKEDVQTQKEPSEEIKPINRDPRLKYGTNAVVASCNQNPTSESNERLAFKYNPKPRKQDMQNDLEKSLLDSIEKSMKESSIPLPPPPKLTAPPAPPVDLFSPESPDDIDKAAVPILLNDLLLNPKTTGVINEVVSALRRSNNEKNLINISTACNNESKHIGKPMLNQSPINIHFSPPPQGLNFIPPPVETPMFVPPKQMMNSQPRGFNPFSPTEQGDISNDRNVSDYHMPRNQGLHFEPAKNPRLLPYEDRTSQGFYIDRPLNYVPPSSIYVPPSPNYVPPSPNYVPPSPLYEPNGDNYREVNVNFQNYQGPNQQPFFQGERMVRPTGLLGDGPRLPYNKSYGQQNYETYGRFGNSSNSMDPRSSYYGGNSRDPRVNTNRCPQFPGQNPRPVCRESRMTYREYKEQKERENREKEMREKELREKESFEKQQREREEFEQKANAVKERDEAEKNQKDIENGTVNSLKSEEREKEGSRFNDRVERSRSRNRSRDRYSRNNSSSRYRRDRDDRDQWRGRGDKKDRDERRGRSRERSRYGESKFDKVYSSRDKIDKVVNNIFNSKTNTGGKGYGTQYKIPKKVKEEEPPKEDDKTNMDVSIKVDKKDKVEENKNMEKFNDSQEAPERNPLIEEENEVIEIKKTIEVIEVDEIGEKELSQKEKTNENMVEENEDKEEPDKENETVENPTEGENNSVSEPEKQTENEAEKCNQKGDKKEEENILSKFFQNLMKSSNKDEKKGALLSLISTFSDSFSDQQLQKITNIIKSGDDEQPKKEEQLLQKEEVPTTSKEEIVNNEKKEGESKSEYSTEKTQEETKTNAEEEIDPIKELKKEINKEEEPIEKSAPLTVVRKVKNRRKSENPKAEIKSKIKVKSELDRLHDDIRDMFIRDGVVTATGKRMCRILKDTSAPSSMDTDKGEDERTEEEIDKKTFVSKRKLRKVSCKRNRETPDVEMKELTVILPKMSLEKIKSTDESSEKEKNENDSNCTKERVDENEEAREHLSDEETSDKESEVNKEKTCPVRKGRQKKRNSWATGVIKKKPGPKSRKPKALISPERNEVKTVEDQENADKILELGADKAEIEDKGVEKNNLNIHDKDYYFKIGQRKLQCKFCDVSTKWIAAHYRTDHPKEEVLCSRLPPHVATMAINNAVQNKEIYENDEEESLIKHEFTCSFCDYKQITLPRLYRDHVSIHTGEFRHKCPYCSFSRSHIKTMQSHVMEVHAEDEAVKKRQIISQRPTNKRNVYGYICQLCNYTQMSIENIEKHLKSYHPDDEKCNIFKIKMNFEAKIEEKCSEDDAKKPVSERPTRRSTKLNQSQEENEVLSDAVSDESKPLKNGNDEKEESEKPEIKLSVDSEKNENADAELEDESANEMETQRPSRLTRNRRKSCRAPSPVKKRLKRKCTLKMQMPSEDAGDEISEESLEKVVKSVDEAVFTSNTDIQEENKRIEEERMKTMQDINSTIKRTSLDFVEKLSHRLKQEEEVIVKQEEVEVVPEEDVLEKLPANDLPVFEKSVLQNREIEPALIRLESSPKMGKDSCRVNPISGVIEKLQGILGNQSISCDDVASPSVSSEELSLTALDSSPDDRPPSLEVEPNNGSPPLRFISGEPHNLPPPLIHMDNVEQRIEKNSIINSETLNIGFIKIMKTTSTYIYVCCLPPCIFSTRDRTAFASHCQNYHQWDQNSPKTTDCLECGVSLTSDEDTNLLTFSLNHAISDHSNFLGTKIGSIRISSNLFPETKPKDQDICSENALLNPPTISIPSPPGCSADDFDSLLDTEPMVEDDEGENPFSIKILNVVSLADESLSPQKTTDHDVEVQNSDKEPGPSQAELESTPPKDLTKTSISALLWKYRSKQTTIASRKTPVALKKFLGNHFDLYKCPDFSCLFTTNKRKMFDIHLRMHPNHKKLMNCLYCDKVIMFESTGSHYESMHGMCRFSCAYCLYRCIAKDYMDIHQLLAHPDVPSRMQLLPKRDSEEKNSISILSEATKGTPIKPYLCCNMEFIYQKQFAEHVDSCSKNLHYYCYFRKGRNICQAPHNNSQELVDHWGTGHGVYPLKCHYCEVGDFDLNGMMIHLVLEHPTLPPDIVNRMSMPVNKSKKPSGLSSVQCNFKQLAIDLKSTLKGSCSSTPESPQPQVLSPTIITTKPSTMQKAFENFVVQKAQPTTLKTVPTYSKVAPINLIQKSPPSISVLKPTSKANVLNAGGLVYCLSPVSSSQSQVLQAIVVNSNNTVGTTVPQKVQLVPTSPTVDRKFKIVKNINNVVPVPTNFIPIAPKGVTFQHKVPKLAPLTPVQHISPIGKVVTSGDTINCPSTVDEEKLEMNKDISEPSVSQKDNSIGEDSGEMDGLEEPMMVIRDELANKEQDEAVDPLSLEMEDPIIAQPPKSPHPSTTPNHEYDSDSKDVDQPEVLVQKSGLVGYQLFRCAKCDMFFPGGCQLKDHLINSTQCRFDNVPNKPYKCYHCGKYLKHYTNLLDHLGYHGHPRFTCSLCNKKFPHSNQVRYHMKTQHNVLNVQMQPLIQSNSNMNKDCFIAKPQVVGGVKSVIQENKSESDAQKSAEVKTVYFSFEADQIPQKSILGYDVTCGHCKKFKNKVRSNIVRHLLLHQNDKEFSVPDTAPVNPVPCLEKNEKMFDKMYNLASSSHTGGRMGGQQKGENNKDNKKETNYPAFVPTNKRYQCCAVGCNYLCLEEGNLRHHLTALHMEDLNFVCVHCKRDLSDAVDVDTIIKHLKLHDLHLYKCSYCDHMHNLKHKIERHINEDHKNKDNSVVVIRAMDAEPYDENQQQTFTPMIVNQKLPKSWKCCMCKYRCRTQEEVVNHVNNKHNIDCRLKCALCAFKTNEVSEFKEHFKDHHPDSEIDIISVYHKDDENNGTVTEVDQFDTTPLWLRDKPRVRHIRGILFEEDPTMKQKKSSQLKSASNAENGKELPGSSVGRKRKRSMSAFSIEDGLVEPKKEFSEVRMSKIKKKDEVIVIDDDEGEELQPTEDKTVESIEEQENDADLICMFGDVGMPANKHFKCPKCQKYKTTKMREFVQHMAGEIRYYRFMCKMCQEKFITLENIQMHCIDLHDCATSCIAYLPIDQQISKWLTLLLKEQRTIIKGLGFACEEIPPNIEDFLGRMEVSHKTIKCKECGFSVSGPHALDRHMKYNHPHIAFGQSSSSTADQSHTQKSTTDKKRMPEESLEKTTETKKLKTLSKGHLIAKDKYVCNECKAEFDSVPEMEFHGKENHKGHVDFSVKTTNLPINFGINRNIYRCRYCPSTGTKTNMEIHIATEHPGQKIDLYRFSCGVCSAKFEMIKTFRHHFKSHDLPDMFCYDVHDRKVTLKTTGLKKKLYRCPVCPYRSQSTNSANIKIHLRLHAKPFKCERCSQVFKTRSDAKTHHMKEHQHNSEAISTVEEMVQKVNMLMEKVMQNVKDVETTDESMEEDVSYTALQPEVILQTAEDDLIDVVGDDVEESNKSDGGEKRYFAKKSTSGLKAKPEQEFYSFYGQRAEPVDMKTIITNFEIADAKMKMTCDQLGRIYNLNPVIRLKDCMTLIINDDDEVSS